MTRLLPARRPLPADDADDLTWLLAQQDDVLSMSQALRQLSRKAIRHRVSTGRWQEPHRSVFVAHNGPIGPAQLRWIAVLAIGDHAVLGGVTAAQGWGLGGYGGAAMHLLVPAGRKPIRVPAGVTVHRSSVLDDRDVLGAGRPPRTRIGRSLVDAAQWARTDNEARAIIAAAFQQRLVSADDIAGVLDRLPRARRRRLIALTAVDAAGGAHSLAEINFLDLCRRHGLPEPSRQVIRHDATGRRRYLDVYFDDWAAAHRDRRRPTPRPPRSLVRHATPERPVDSRRPHPQIPPPGPSAPTRRR